MKGTAMLVIGHRGAAGHATENTLRSFQAGIDLGVDLVEADIQATRDGQLVVFHDKLLQRLTGASGYLWDHDYVQLRAEVRVAGDYPIPLLSEVCDLLRGSSVRLMAELVTPGIERAALAVLSRSLGADGYLLASFHHRTLRSARAIATGVGSIALWEGAPVDAVRMASDCGADYVGLGFESTCEEQVRALKAAGVGVLVWTVNEPDEIKRARALAVDGIITDFPERVRAEIGPINTAL
jgi:glycerophosphoryl diester phosphodiesterase